MYVNAFGVAFLDTFSLGGKCLFNLMDYNFVLVSYMIAEPLRVDIEIRSDMYARRAIQRRKMEYLTYDKIRMYESLSTY